MAPRTIERCFIISDDGCILARHRHPWGSSKLRSCPRPGLLVARRTTPGNATDEQLSDVPAVKPEIAPQNRPFGIHQYLEQPAMRMDEEIQVSGPSGLKFQRSRNEALLQMPSQDAGEGPRGPVLDLLIREARQ
uniref:Uncharacterized protein n=1 Tax=Rhodosorus marinus TaxID=101924 RepID=A0A7S0G1M0_9RHOD|mmetsp:Transcript_1659/g.2543  ORF Transcript_1659/g.2543 Transcript_1659/m.2543 type:complete len:134 (+) Transcript_1659:130-531(+)